MTPDPQDHAVAPLPRTDGIGPLDYARRRSPARQKMSGAVWVVVALAVVCCGQWLVFAYALLLGSVARESSIIGMIVAHVVGFFAGIIGLHVAIDLDDHPLLRWAVGAIYVSMTAMLTSYCCLGVSWVGTSGGR